MSREINRGDLLDTVFTLEIVALLTSIIVAATNPELVGPSIAVAGLALLSLPITSIINSNFR